MDGTSNEVIMDVWSTAPIASEDRPLADAVDAGRATRRLSARHSSSEHHRPDRCLSWILINRSGKRQHAHRPGLTGQ